MRRRVCGHPEADMDPRRRIHQEPCSLMGEKGTYLVSKTRKPKPREPKQTGAGLVHEGRTCGSLEEPKLSGYGSRRPGVPAPLYLAWW